MSELIEKLHSEFQDPEYRQTYAEECLNTMVATQIKVLREQRGLTQKQLAELTGMAQPRITVLEDASYENWTISTLKRFAKAFDVALSVKFETFSQLLIEFERLSRETLQRPAFANDARFQERKLRTRHRTKHLRGRRRKRTWVTRIGQSQVSGMGLQRKPPKSAEGIALLQGAGELGQTAAAAGGR